MDKRSSLLQKSVNYGQKSFIVLAPGFGRGGNVGLDGLVVVDVVRVDDDDGTARRVIVVRFPDWTTSNGKNQVFEMPSPPN